MSRPLEDRVAILVLHLLSDVQGFLRTLFRLGLDPERTVLLNIPYSTKQDTVAALWASGLRNVYVSADYPIDTAVSEAVAMAAELAEATGASIVVVEDGGYVGPYIHAHQPDLLPRVIGIVEQTKNGIWQYEEQGIAPQVPVVSVAESELKNSLESPLIGRAILRNVEDLIARIGYSLSNLNTLLVGYGATGSQAAIHLSSACRSLRIFDADTSRREEARTAGFDVVDELTSACPDADVVIGCTGKDSIGSDALLAFHGQTYFANGSSKRRELDWSAIRSLDDGVEVLPGGIGTRMTLQTGATLTILADGYPVNFVGESVPDEEIAFVYGLLLRSLLLLINGGLEAGFHDVPLEVQGEVRDDHFRILGREPPGNDA